MEPDVTMVREPQVTLKDYKAEQANDWCPGCGDFGILSALQSALVNLALPPHRVAVFGGIGCSGKTPYYLKVYGVHTLHGRLLPFAIGAKLANPELTVIAVGGDGDGMAIGAGHFINAGRRNVDLTYILFNNEVYGLTKGQGSPTLPLGLQPKSLPEPNISGQLNPLVLALASGFTWIGRGYAYDVKGLSRLIQEAIQHPGLAYLDVLQPCPTYNNIHTKDFFAGKDLPDGRSRLYSLQDEGYDPLIPPDADQATINAKVAEFFARANEWGDRIPTGVFLVNRSVPTYEERIARRMPSYRDAPPGRQPISRDGGRPAVDLSVFFDELIME
jgi:2-oxoglutarate ferredoxin oxidoreductase subunit beta